MTVPTNRILEVEDLTVRFPVTGGVLLRRVGEVRAVDHVSFHIGRGETLGLVGESGCGKTTVGRAIVNILSAMAYGVEVSGKILYHQESGTVVDLAKMSRSGMRPYRSDIQMVFQDPYASLNPRHRVGDIIAAGPMGIGIKRDVAYARAEQLVQTVGLPASCLGRFPHQFSGGQRQRLSIARALAMQPRLLVADEAVSALDVSVQAQVLTLLRQIRQQFGLSMLFITHDLRVASALCDRIVVMRSGRIVEQGPAWSICGSPQETYTRELIDAIPGRATR